MSDDIGELISGAESLISSIYGTTLLSDIATLTWPSTVVVDGSTYVVTETSTSATLVTSTVTSDVSTSSSATPASTSTAASSTASSSSGKTASQTSSSTITGTGVAAAATSSSTTTSDPKASQSDAMDKRLGIGLGIGLALLALLLLLAVFLCLRRRKRRTGSYIKQHHSDVPDDGEIESWRGAQSPYAGNHQTRIWSDKDAVHQTTTPAGTHDRIAPVPPVMMAGALHNNHSNRSDPSSSESSWHTPNEAPAELVGDHSHASPERQPFAGAGSVPSMSENPRRNRPSTPLVHEMMGFGTGAEASRAADNPGRRSTSSGGGIRRKPVPQTPVSPISPNQTRYSELSGYSNPFASAEDDEADEGMHVPVPPRSPERKNNPHVHYPSQPEISGFDFGIGGQGRGGHGYEPMNDDGRW